MGYFVATFLFLYGIILYIIKRTFSSPDIMFCLEWGLISLLASFKLFSMYSASDKAWIIIFCGCLSFLIGTFLTNIIKFKKGFNSKNKCQSGDVNKNKEVFMKEKTFWFLMSFMFIYTLYLLSKSIEYIRLGYTLGEIREASVGMANIDGYIRRTGFFSESVDLIFSTVELIVNAVGINYFVCDMKKNYKMIMAVLILEILLSFANGGRFGLAYIIIEVLVCISLYKKSGKNINFYISPKLKKKVKKIIFILFATIIIITLVRGAKINELIVKYYRYICGNIVFFDLHIPNIDSSNIYSFPFAGMYGLWSVILPIFNFIGISYPKMYLYTVENVMTAQIFMKIGDNLHTNAFITPFYYLYADFRWFGVIFGMFIFGMLASYIYKKATIYMDSTHIVYYLIVSQMIFKTLQTYPLTNKTYVAVILFVIIRSLKKRKIKRRNYSIS